MLSFLQTEKTWEGEIAVVSNVTLKNAGLYECSVFDLINYEESKGNATLEIHCKL